MAKENKNNQQQTAVVDVDNISSVVRKDGIATVEITKAAMDGIAKDKAERIQRQIAERMLQSEFMRKLKLIQLRKRRKENDVTLKYLKEAEILQYQMSGFLLNDEHIAKMGGKDGKLEIEVVEYNKDGETEKVKKTFEVKKGEEIWVPASITCPEYDELCNKMKKEEEKEKTAIEKQYTHDKENLASQYPSYYSWRWDW